MVTRWRWSALIWLRMGHNLHNNHQLWRNEPKIHSIASRLQPDLSVDRKCRSGMHDLCLYLRLQIYVGSIQGCLYMSLSIIRSELVACPNLPGGSSRTGPQVLHHWPPSSFGFLGIGMPSGPKGLVRIDPLPIGRVDLRESMQPTVSQTSTRQNSQNIWMHDKPKTIVRVISFEKMKTDEDWKKLTNNARIRNHET